jgi:hypothetical protein
VPSLKMLLVDLDPTAGLSLSLMDEIKYKERVENGWTLVNLARALPLSLRASLGSESAPRTAPPGAFQRRAVCLESRVLQASRARGRRARPPKTPQLALGAQRPSERGAPPGFQPGAWPRGARLPFAGGSGAPAAVYLRASAAPRTPRTDGGSRGAQLPSPAVGTASTAIRCVFRWKADSLWAGAPAPHAYNRARERAQR